MKIEKFLRKIFHRIYNKLFIRSLIDDFIRLSALDEAVGIAVNNQLEGDYFEFGVFRGDSFARAYHNYSQNSKNIRMPEIFENTNFIAFDSFEGLPETKDSNVPKQYFKGSYSASERYFLSNIRRKGVDINKVKIVSGFYDKSLNSNTVNEFELNKVSVAYFDVDLYESTKQALDFIIPLLQNGSILVFDDWYRHKCLPSNGVQRACNEWLDENKNIKLSVVHRYRRIAFSVEIV